MPMAFDNLVVVQHYDTLRFATIRIRRNCPHLQRFALGDYVYLQQTSLVILDVLSSRIILKIKNILPSGALKLEGHDG